MHRCTVAVVYNLAVDRAKYGAIAFASWSLSDTQENILKWTKMLLAIIFGVKHFH